MKRFSFSRRVNPDSGPTVSRRSALTMRYLCATLALLFSLGIGQMWATEGDVVYKLNTGSTTIATSSSYDALTTAASCATDGTASVSTAKWKFTCGAKQTTSPAGFWLGSNNNQKAKMKLSQGSIAEGSAIATAISVSNTATYYAALISETALPNVGKVTLTYSATGGTAPSEAWICYSTDDGSTWSIAKKVTTLSTSGTDFEFDETIESARYAFVIHSSAYCQFKVPVLTFYEGATAAPSTPYVSVDPDALSFGTVEQNASVAAKTFSVTGSNLTDAITITSPNAGFTVTPASITPTDGAIAATDVTVTPVTTAANTFDGNVVISGGGLENSVTVALTMTVAAPEAVTGVSLNKEATSLEIGASETLTATIAPEEATNKNVTWESSDDAVATVENGVVTAVAVGNATITCKSVADNTITATCAVTVTAENPVATFNATKDKGTSPLTKKRITFACTNGVLNNSSEYRLYKNSVTTFTVSEGYQITKIEFTGVSGNAASGFGTPSVGNWETSGADGTWTGRANPVEFTASGAQVRATQIVVTYSAIAPEVTSSSASLNFDAKQNVAVDGKTFTLTGANLESDLTLAASEGFTVTPTAITAADAMAGNVEVSVTPDIPAATTTPVEGTVTISGGGLASNVVVNLSMAVTPTYAISIAKFALDGNSDPVGDLSGFTATLNGGTATVYAAEDETLNLVAEPATGYEFSGWTLSEENIVITDANAATTTANTIIGDVTITANFQAQACTNLDAPTLDEITKTYQSATIAWNAVANASSYAVSIVNHSTSASVFSGNVNTLSKELTGLAANTQYDYTVMAVGDGSAYCNESNPLLEGNFTTNDYPTVAVTYSENGVTTNANNTAATAKKILTPFALPTTVENEISGKTFVGWTTKADFTNGDEAEATYYAAGADFTIESNAAVTLYAVYATAGSGAGDPWQITKDDLKILDNSQSSTYNKYKGDQSKGGITFNITDVMPGTGDNAGKIQLKANAGIIYNKTAFEADIVSIEVTDVDLAVYEGTDVISSTPASGKITASGSDPYTYTFSAGKRYFHIKKASSGAGYVTSITVNLAGGASYTDYAITGSAQLPKLAAPTFNLEAGSYYETKSVTLSATNDAAIYYTLDGTDPTNESSLYEEAIALSARQEYTIKAIAVKAGFETSEVASRAYNIVLPYDFADFAALEKVNNKEYAVRGIISQKDAFNSQYSEIPYYISANGQTEGQIKCYNGLGLNKATFESADDVNLGDNVTVVGTWSTQHSNFNAANWMLEYTPRVHASYAIEGNLTASSFDDGDAFDDAILANLTVKETFNTGYYANVAGVTFNVGEKTAWAEGDTKLTVNAVLNEVTIATKDFDVTVSSAQLSSIALKADDSEYQTKVVYYLGEDFVAPTIVATLDDASSYEAVATYVSGFDNTDATANNGVQEVTVSYTRGEVTKTVSYNITMKAIFNNEDAPHTVAVANALINAFGGNSASSEYMWIRGIVSGFKGTSNNQYYISDDGTETDQLYVYNGKYFNDATMNATNKPAVGDVVILKTKMQIYSNAPELSSSVVVYQLREPEFAIADIVADDEFEANVSEDMTVVPTVNSGDAEFTLTSGNEAVVTIVNGKLHAVAEGDAVITASRAATNNANALNYTAKEITFNVHVIAERTRYTVTFDKNGGTGTDPEAIANQLAGATVDMPAACLYNKEGHGFTGWKVINLSNSEEIEVVNDQFVMPAANVKIQAQWAEVATCAISFQVNGAEVATANAPQEADYNITQVGAEVPGFTFLGWSETEYADEVETVPTTINVYHAEAGEESKVLYGIYSRLDEGEEVTDILTVTDFTSTGSSYTEFSNVQKNSTAKYAGKTAKNGTNIQLNKKAENGFYSSVSGGTLVSVVIEMTSATKKLGVYGSNDGFTGYTNIPSQAGVTKLEDFASVASKTITPNADYKYVGIASSEDGAKYIASVAITWQPKAIYYTSSPVEKVTVTFALDGGEGGCQTTKINKGSQLTICADVPTKEHSEFAGWKNGDDVYEAGQAYTFNADITLTAQWNTAAKYTVTYAKGGDDVTGSVPTDENSPYFAGEQVTVLGQGGLEKSGYEFQGWLNGNKLYAKDATFAMPAENVTLTAQWIKANIADVVFTDKMALISDASGLINGMEVALGCSHGEDFYMAGEISNNVMDSVKYGVSLSNGVATLTSRVVILTAEQVGNGWKLRKDAENYLKENTAKKVAWGTSAEATIWTISFNNGNAVIANGSNRLQFNSSNPRFTTYSSAQTAIQLFGKAIVVAQDPTAPAAEVEVNLSDMGYIGEDQPIVASGENVTLTIDVPTTTPSITATNGATVVIDAPTTAQSVNVEEGSKIEANEPTTTPIVTFATTLGSTDAPSTGSALGTANNITLAAGGEIHYDLTLATSMAGKQADENQWHAFTVPFPVDAQNGVYNAATDTKLASGVDYYIMDYHGDIRANGQYGWRKFRGMLVPGVFYVMTVNGDVKTFRFKMSVAANTVLQALNSMAYTAFGGTDETNPDYGWNGIGNPSWVSVTLGYDVQVLDPYSYEYQTLTAGTVISAGTPFFYKANTTSTMTMTESNANADYAPARTPVNEIKKMAVSFGNEVFADKLYISASEDALNSYEQDKDLVKMRMSKTPKVAQIFGEAYGMKLSMVNTPMENDNAEVALDLYTPAAGEYTISVPAVEGYNVYLVREGSIIWNLSTSEYTADFDKGDNAGYSIRIVRAPQMPTDLGNIYDTADGVQKVVIDDNVYILRNEKMYDVTGKMVK